MSFIVSLLPATVFAIMGYVVLYCAINSEGRMSIFGKVLAVWVFILALFFPLSGAYMAISGFSPEVHFQQMHEKIHGQEDEIR